MARLSKQFKAELLEIVITATINAAGHVLKQIGESLINGEKIEKGGKDTSDQRKLH
jgi:hypothetical protein